MAKTYESIYTNEDGRELIIARGTEEYVKTVTPLWGFVPFRVRAFQSERNITEDYRAFRKKYGNHKPNRAVVKIQWDDEEDGNTRLDTIALRLFDCNKYPSDDNEILYYVSGLKGLLSLMKPNNGSKFVVKEVVQFYRHIEK